jgi:hypothetical protein
MATQKSLEQFARDALVASRRDGTNHLVTIVAETEDAKTGEKGVRIFHVRRTPSAVLRAAEKRKNPDGKPRKDGHLIIAWEPASVGMRYIRPERIVAVSYKGKSLFFSGKKVSTTKEAEKK